MSYWLSKLDKKQHPETASNQGSAQATGKLVSPTMDNRKKRKLNSPGWSAALVTATTWNLQNGATLLFDLSIRLSDDLSELLDLVSQSSDLLNNNTAAAIAGGRWADLQATLDSTGVEQLARAASSNHSLMLTLLVVRCRTNPMVLCARTPSS